MRVQIMEIHLKLSVITICYKSSPELSITLDSIDRQDESPYENIVVISGVNNNDILRLENGYSKPYRKFIFNQDNSLFHAMNIGLKEATGNCVLYLNGGDYFYSDVDISKIHKKWSADSILRFQVVQLYKDMAWIRPGRKNINKNANWAHCGTIIPIDRKKIYFDESKKISADTSWINSYKLIYDSICSEEILTCFELGGVSSSPSVKTIKIHKSNSTLKMLNEILKMFLMKMAGRKRYYQLLAIKSGFDRIKYNYSQCSFEKYRQLML